MSKISSISFKGYKVFPKQNTIALEQLSLLNVFIGKNNCGKTSLLDVVECAYSGKSSIKPGTDIEELIVSYIFDESIVKAIFSGYSSIGSWKETSFLAQIQGHVMPVEILSNNMASRFNEKVFNDIRPHLTSAVNKLDRERNDVRFVKISAERNINPEGETQDGLLSTGEGATNLIRMFINDSNYDELVIESTLLNALNHIMRPEAEFDSIRVQEVEYQKERKWEVFLKEKEQSRVPLSKMGSGVKTVILVLLSFYVLPLLKEYKDKEIVYGFEELENNLHPALQRRLFEFIYNYAIEHETIIYLTTHSHIAINTFFSKKDASIFHIEKKSAVAGVKRIESYIDKVELLDDLEVKASDLLQSNGIIWVEGPSDRIYVKRWLEIFTDNKYEEGRDYQFLYYGGRLLSQYSAEEETELISIITTNRNGAILIDSDKRYSSAPVNNTKRRVKSEFDKLSMFVWITKGKEIENYVPKEAIESMLDISLEQPCGSYELFPTYIKDFYPNFSNKKVHFAEIVRKFITLENSRGILDLERQTKMLYEQIAKWNY